MPECTIENRRFATAQDWANSALRGLEPSAFGPALFEPWAVGNLTGDEAATLLMTHHKNLEKRASSSNHDVAFSNKILASDSPLIKHAETGIAKLSKSEMDAK